MFYALTIDASGNGIGSHAYVEEPTTYPANEIACTQAQAQNPMAYRVVNGQIVESLSWVQSTQITLLQAGYQAAVNAPVTFKNAIGVTSSYPSGNTVLINGQRAKDLLAEIISAGSSAWTLGKWLDVNNIPQTFTFADLQGLAQAMEAAITLDWTDLITKIAEVNAATTVEAVKSITW